jgi:hypothetical protein
MDSVFKYPTILRCSKVPEDVRRVHPPYSGSYYAKYGSREVTGLKGL